MEYTPLAHMCKSPACVPSAQRSPTASQPCLLAFTQNRHPAAAGWTGSVETVEKPQITAIPMTKVLYFQGPFFQRVPFSTVSLDSASRASYFFSSFSSETFFSLGIEWIFMLKVRP